MCTLDYKHANEILVANNKSVLWLGDCSAAEDLDWLRKHNVRTGRHQLI